MKISLWACLWSISYIGLAEEEDLTLIISFMHTTEYEYILYEYVPKKHKGSTDVDICGIGSHSPGGSKNIDHTLPWHTGTNNTMAFVWAAIVPRPQTRRRLSLVSSGRVQVMWSTSDVKYRWCEESEPLELISHDAPCTFPTPWWTDAVWLRFFNSSCIHKDTVWERDFVGPDEPVQVKPWLELQ